MDGSSPTTAGRSRSTCSSRSPCTAAPSSSAARPGSATISTSCRRIRARCSRSRAERLRARRRDQRPDVEGGLRHALRGRTADREHRALPRRRAVEESFDGHANCFIETGFGKALLIDFNYETEPLPGRFPSALGAATAPPGVAAQPPREADVPVDVLAPAAARGATSRASRPTCTCTARNARRDGRQSERRTEDDDATLDGSRRPRRRGIPHRPRPVERGDRRRDRPRRRHRRADPAPLAGRPLHADTYLATGEAPSIRTLGKHPASRSKSSTSSSPRAPPSSPPRSAAFPSPTAASRGGDDDDHGTRPRQLTHAEPARRSPDDREGLDHHLEGIAGRRLPGPDHGQRSPHGRDRGERLLHLLRARGDHEEAPGEIKVATVGNPGMHMPTLIGALPGCRGSRRR